MWGKLIERHLYWSLAVRVILACIAIHARVACADCIDAAAAQYQVNADVLRAIAYRESGMNASALHKNSNGSIDVGLMQINSVNFAYLEQKNIAPERLHNPATNALAGAALLRRQIDRYGDTWRAVGAYHSITPALSNAYAAAIHDVYVKRRWERRPHISQSSQREKLVSGVEVQFIRID
ncbi:lytic transglycosylase domain-containing protein [Burkholderia sp. BE17]|uniref:lytic transglycosylase domain-containing protein n=1 Tax=Burkholderia sp. BE17 TaxID=2656644 RepID=UPI00128D7041|nr:lytic transglycosylase domain-containing protein [Burkholderia sp. BE17]MPV70217.1 transglycosylase SLT domain-containing protein [Burkholderia sp. BE17]